MLGQSQTERMEALAFEHEAWWLQHLLGEKAAWSDQEERSGMENQPWKSSMGPDWGMGGKNREGVHAGCNKTREAAVTGQEDALKKPAAESPEKSLNKGSWTREWPCGTTPGMTCPPLGLRSQTWGCWRNVAPIRWKLWSDKTGQKTSFKG